MNKTPNLALVYDFETSGLPLFSEPSDHPNQPHVVQVGAQLVNMDTRIVVQSLDVIVRPVGWTIPDEVAQVHRSPGFITSNLIGKNEDGTLIKGECSVLLPRVIARIYLFCTVLL